MCLTLATATTIIDHHPGRGYTRTWHHACRLSPGDLWRPDPNGRPRTVTEVHRTRDRANLPDLVDPVRPGVQLPVGRARPDGGPGSVHRLHHHNSSSAKPTTPPTKPISTRHRRGTRQLIPAGGRWCAAFGHYPSPVARSDGGTGPAPAETVERPGGRARSARAHPVPGPAGCTPGGAAGGSGAGGSCGSRVRDR
jgi:hypothetical protein